MGLNAEGIKKNHVIGNRTIFMSLERVCKQLTLQAEFGSWHLKASVAFFSLGSGFLADSYYFCSDRSIQTQKDI